MTLEQIRQLPKCPKWLKDPNIKVSNEDIELVGSSITWIDGIWHGGTWIDGDWKNGTWKDGTWKDGDWHNGTWEKGTFESGHWNGGTWKNGTFSGNSFEFGKWLNGVWKGGYFIQSTWENGVWLDGTFGNGSIWKNGTWHKGYFQGAQWYDGTWKSGYFYYHGARGGNWHGGKWGIGDIRYFPKGSNSPVTAKKSTIPPNKIQENKRSIKMTKTQLRQIIKEEYNNLLLEAEEDMYLDDPKKTYDLIKYISKITGKITPGKVQKLYDNKQKTVIKNHVKKLLDVAVILHTEF